MKALVVVDMQNDFLPGGPLGVPGAHLLVPLINALMKNFSLVVATKDWHLEGHVSFAKSHPQKKVGDKVDIEGVEQILWPVHCIQNTPGAAFARGLETKDIKEVFFKGVDLRIDSYSTFFDQAQRRSTGMETYLREKGVDTLYFAGVATDYCVLYSALDALLLGFKVYVIRDCCAPINLHPDDEKKALDKMKKQGAHIIESKEGLCSG
jgi:nicotinamidase/pyrazinamidase